jgi:uncharacterized protein YjbJ (UPF0337 family)
MINQQVLEGNWNQFKGQIRQKWGQLTDNDVAQFQGNVDELVGVIQQKTGEGREAIECFLQEITQGAGAAVSNAVETARQYVHQATNSVRGSARQATDQVCEGIEGAKYYARERPAESLAICFGTGLIAGVLLTVALRAK